MDPVCAKASLPRHASTAVLTRRVTENRAHTAGGRLSQSTRARGGCPVCSTPEESQMHRQCHQRQAKAPDTVAAATRHPEPNPRGGAAQPVSLAAGLHWVSHSTSRPEPKAEGEESVCHLDGQRSADSSLSQSRVGPSTWGTGSSPKLDLTSAWQNLEGKCQRRIIPVRIH